MRRHHRIDTDLKVGDILYNSWGYNMTHIDYFKVVRVTKRTAFVREMAKQSARSGEWDSHGFYGYVVPAEDVDLGTVEYQVATWKYDEEIPDNPYDKPLPEDVSYHSRLDHHTTQYLSKWDGEPKYFNHLD